MNEFSGIYPILYAFFRSDGQLDRDAMRAQADACLNGGAHGIAALGLATEVSKLSMDERYSVMRWLLADVAGRVPVAITVFGTSVKEQIDFIREAHKLGAAWVILQPPPQRPLEEPELLRFFGKVADGSPLPVAIQNAPQYLGVGLGTDSLVALRRNHQNFVLLKGEASAVEIERQIDALGGEIAVFNGRGGLELTDVLRAGCVGLIPAPECFDAQVKIFNAHRAGDHDLAENLYRDILPLVTFCMQSIDQFLCYGKRLTAHRLGLGPVHDRSPALEPTPFGLDCLRRHAKRFGPYGDG